MFIDLALSNYILGGLKDRCVYNSSQWPELCIVGIHSSQSFFWFVNLKKFLRNFILCVWLLCLLVYLCVWYPQRPERAQVFLEQMLLTCHGWVLGMEHQVLWKSSHLSKPKDFNFLIICRRDYKPFCMG